MAICYPLSACNWLIVIHFAINYKLARDCLSPYNNAGLISSFRKSSHQNQRKIATVDNHYRLIPLHDTSSRPYKVDDFGTNQKCVCDFLLVCHRNLVAILQSFRDTVTYWQKLQIFPIRLIRCHHSLCHLWKFVVKLTTKKLQSCSKDCMIVAWVVLI